MDRHEANDCINAGDFCENCFMTIQNLGLTLSFFDLQTFLDINEKQYILNFNKDRDINAFQKWISGHVDEISKKYVSSVQVCSLDCMKRILGGKFSKEYELSKTFSSINRNAGSADINFHRDNEIYKSPDGLQFAYISFHFNASFTLKRMGEGGVYVTEHKHINGKPGILMRDSIRNPIVLELFDQAFPKYPKETTIPANPSALFESAQIVSKEAENHFSSGNYQQALSSYERVATDLRRAKDRSTAIGAGSPIPMQVLDDYIETCNQNIKNCKHGIDNQRIETLYAESIKMLENASDVRLKGEILKARQIIIEANNKANEAFDLSNNLGFNDINKEIALLLSYIRKEQDTIDSSMVGMKKVTVGEKPKLAPIGRGILKEHESEINTSSNQSIEDIYATHKKIGSGGYSNVYQATRIKDGVSVALKIPKSKEDWETISEDLIKSFENEATIWSKLDHANIVKLYEFGSRPYPWIAMELMEGGSLRDRLPLTDIRNCLTVLDKVFEGVYYAHRRGIIHRDIKPENILFTKEDNPKISDWGIAKALLFASKSSTSRYTLMYAAPEQLAPKKFGPVDWWTDVFQLGVLTYEMMTGKMPFGGEDVGEIMFSITSSDPVKPGDINSELTAEIDEVIMRALDKDPKKRFESVSEFRNQLKSCYSAK